ncbi:uncharacterized protein LOC126891435 [Diabrotica virgifera virgifera]|uniref:Endonuclease/exonuclease/phosphatase domain-containing protein n=1 Tax=Diabrotica virgifera virgifera TaxID=50390 RepID=A0ABM5L2A5_DIAVI|nr:uncharacterized protein LOC126891435 [Diabrotica virgifera virgifera]
MTKNDSWKSKSNICVYYLNTGGMRTKIQSFHQAPSCSCYDIVMIAETWLNSDYSDAEVGVPEYDIYRCDREVGLNTLKTRGGGVLIAAKKSLSIQKIIVPLVDSDIYQLYLTFKIKTQNFVIGCVYIPSPSPSQSYLRHCESVEYVYNNFSDSLFVLAGDYNLPQAKWGNDELGLTVTGTENESVSIVANCFSFHNFFQRNEILNNNGVSLDLVFSNLESINVTPAVDKIFENSLNHTAISFELVCEENLDFMNYEEYFYDFRNGDYFSINNYLASINWEGLFLSGTADSMVVIFYDIIYSLIEHFVPLKKYKISTFPSWFSSELRNLIVCKKQAHKQYKISNRQDDYDRFVALRNQCEILRADCQKQYLDRIQNNISDNPK